MKLHSITPCNFQGKYNYTIYGEHNKNVPYLYNQVTDFIRGKGVPACFHLGKEDKIVMEPATQKIADMVKKGLDKLGIKGAHEPKV
jgi:hypothetical protein